jgi:hypothetical protein
MVGFWEAPFFSENSAATLVSNPDTKAALLGYPPFSMTSTEGRKPSRPTQETNTPTACCEDSSGCRAKTVLVVFTGLGFLSGELIFCPRNRKRASSASLPGIRPELASVPPCLTFVRLSNYYDAFVFDCQTIYSANGGPYRGEDLDRNRNLADLRRHVRLLSQLPFRCQKTAVSLRKPDNDVVSLPDMDRCGGPITAYA